MKSCAMGANLPKTNGKPGSLIISGVLSVLNGSVVLRSPRGMT
jgi:hypothetical protein